MNKIKDKNYEDCENCCGKLDCCEKQNCCGKIGENGRYDFILEAFDGCSHNLLVKKANELMNGDKYDRAAGKLINKMLFITSLYERFSFQDSI